VSTPNSDTFGPDLSATTTVRVAVAAPAVYVIVYVPGTFVSTMPETWTGVDAPHDAAVAPASAYEPWQSTLAGLLPAIVISGAD
jgi:hypothetical protein